MNREDFILMTVGGLTLDPVTKTPIVILRDPENKLNLPIWIGLLEATSMATELEGIKMARPMTHDLLRTVLEELEAAVEWVEVTELRENTYFALIYVRVGDRQLQIDARPSDAISLALRTKSPIYVAKAVLEATSMATELEGIKMARPMTHDLLRSILEELEAAVEWVEVTELRENTYFALIYVRVGDRQLQIDARPSDAISLALRTKSPIYVAKAVLEASSVLQQMEEGKEQDLSNVSRDKWAEILEKMSPDDFKYKM